MPTKIIFLILCFQLTPTQYVSAAVEMENVSASAHSSISGDSVVYSNNLQMREERKVGVGLGVGGVLGFIGTNLELNLEDENATLLGFGGGGGYSTFHLQWKHSFEGQYFTPYFTTGFARWYNTQERNLQDSSYVLRTVLNEETIKQGVFTSDFIVGSIGLQYNELEGDFFGAGFYFEFNLLGSLSKSTIIPSGGIGAIYYF